MEGTRTNFFFSDGKKIFTPPKNKVLDGVTRQKVIEIARINQIEVEEPKKNT